jgi:hypothetical protein
MKAMAKLGLDDKLSGLLAEGAVMAGEYARDNNKAIPWNGNDTSNSQKDWFNLNDLQIHNFIEHDASLSRKDAATGGEDNEYVGNNTKFDKETWQQVLDVYGDAEYTSIDLQAKAMNERYQTSEKNNAKSFKDNYRAKTALLRYGESAMIMQVFGEDTKGGKAKIEDIKRLFGMWQSLCSLSSLYLCISLTLLHRGGKIPRRLQVQEGGLDQWSHRQHHGA